MNYLEAKRKVTLKRLLGLFVVSLCATITIISILKFIYFGLDENAAIFGNLALMIKQFVYAIYVKTQFVNFIWQNAPNLTQENLLSLSNLWVLLWYLGIFLGVSIIRSGNKLAKRLKEIDLKIENELIQQSISQQGQARTKTQIQAGTVVPKQSFLKEIHTLYIAPLIVGAILLVLSKLIGAA